MLMYFLCTFPCFSAWHRTRYLLNTQKNRSSLHQHIRSFLHKHTLNIFVSIYRIILTGGGGSFTEPSTAASRLSFALWTWLEPLSELTEQSWLLHYYLSQKPLRASLFFFSSFSFSFSFFFLFKSWHTGNYHKHGVVGVNCSSHVAGLRCTFDIFTSSKKSPVHAHTHVAVTASVYPHRTYDHHSYCYKPWLN